MRLKPPRSPGRISCARPQSKRPLRTAHLPIPAVIPSAKAPQNVTRSIARGTLAPPALAPMAPSNARKPSDAAETIGTSKFAGRDHDHQQRHGCPHRKHHGRCERGLNRTRGRDFGNPKLIACVSGERIFCHQLAGNLLRRGPIDAALDVDFGKFVVFGLRIVAQFPAFSRKIRLLGVGL